MLCSCTSQYHEKIQLLKIKPDSFWSSQREADETALDCKKKELKQEVGPTAGTKRKKTEGAPPPLLPHTKKRKSELEVLVHGVLSIVKPFRASP